MKTIEYKKENYLKNHVHNGVNIEESDTMS